MGGDEFAIVQVAIVGTRDATTLAQRIIDGVSGPYEIDGHQVVIGTSVGIAVGPCDGANPDQLLQQRGPGALPGQGQRARHLLLLRAGDGRADAGAPQPWRTTCARRWRRASSSSTTSRSSTWRATRSAASRRSIRWHHPEKGMIAPGRVHSAGRGDRPDRADRRMGDPGGLRHGRAMARTISRSPSTSRLRNSSNPGFVQLVSSALAASGLLARPAGARDHRDGAAVGQRGDARHAASAAARSACASPSTTSAPAIPRSAICRAFPSTGSRSTARSCKNIAERAGSLNIVRAVAALANGLGIPATAEGVENMAQLELDPIRGLHRDAGLPAERALPAHEIEQLFFATAASRRPRTTQPRPDVRHRGQAVLRSLPLLHTGYSKFGIRHDVGRCRSTNG